MKPLSFIPATLAALAFACSPGTSSEISDREQLIQNGNPLSGAIFTTLEDGTSVNANIYEAKEDVYLDGGPGPNAPASAAGLPAGDYFFQVTDPSGKDLLSSDHITCRRVQVSPDGVITASFPGTTFVRDKGNWVEIACQHNTGVDADHSELGAITVQLMPYDDTPNNGGVYKVWMTPVDEYIGDTGLVPVKAKDNVNGEGWEPNDFHGFVPAHSKTDNYKVKFKGKPCDPPVLTVRKFHDANMDGVKGADEVYIEGWPVSVIDSVDAGNNYFTTFSIFTDEGLWSATEATPAGTLQTASYLDGALVSSYPAADPSVHVFVDGDCGESHDIEYGNVGSGSIMACKWYDRDADGTADDDEPGIAGWRFELSGTDASGAAVGPTTQTASSAGCTVFSDLLPGNYTVTELIPATGGWFATGDISQDVTVTSTLDGALLSGSQELVEFTNGCEAIADFGTKGFWHNKNGLAEMNDSDIAFANALLPYSSPSSYFEAGDEPFDGQFEDGTPVAAAHGIAGELLAPEGSARAEVSSFLIDSNADGDHREQLAQQLLAFIFNTLNRTGGLGSAIQAPDGTWVSTTDLINDAVAAWAGGTDEERVAIKDVLDAFNNGDAIPFIPYNPCDVNY